MKTPLLKDFRFGIRSNVLASQTKRRNDWSSRVIVLWSFAAPRSGNQNHESSISVCVSLSLNRNSIDTTNQSSVWSSNYHPEAALLTCDRLVAGQELLRLPPTLTNSISSSLVIVQYSVWPTYCSWCKQSNGNLALICSIRVSWSTFLTRVSDTTNTRNYIHHFVLPLWGRRRVPFSSE